MITWIFSFTCFIFLIMICELLGNPFSKIYYGFRHVFNLPLTIEQWITLVNEDPKNINKINDEGMKIVVLCRSNYSIRKIAKHLENPSEAVIQAVLSIDPDMSKLLTSPNSDYPDIDTDYLPEIRNYLKNDWAKKFQETPAIQSANRLYMSHLYSQIEKPVIDERRHDEDIWIPVRPNDNQDKADKKTIQQIVQDVAEASRKKTVDILVEKVETPEQYKVTQLEDWPIPNNTDLKAIYSYGCTYPLYDFYDFDMPGYASWFVKDGLEQRINKKSRAILDCNGSLAKEKLWIFCSTEFADYLKVKNGELFNGIWKIIASSGIRNHFIVIGKGNSGSAYSYLKLKNWKLRDWSIPSNEILNDFRPTMNTWKSTYNFQDSAITFHEHLKIRNIEMSRCNEKRKWIYCSEKFKPLFNDKTNNMIFDNTWRMIYHGNDSDIMLLGSSCHLNAPDDYCQVTIKNFKC